MYLQIENYKWYTHDEINGDDGLTIMESIMRSILYGIFTLSLCMQSLYAEEFKLVPADVGGYGTINETISCMLKDCVIEKVTVNVKNCAASPEVIQRHGIVTRRPHAKANILLCHGFMCCKFDIGFLRSIIGPEYNYLTMDFRGHGEHTQGQCCTFGRDERLDVYAAAEFMKHHPEIGHLPLIVYGFSMGAAAAIEAQAAHPDLFTAMILDCPFDSVENALKRCVETLTISFFGYKFAVPGRHLLHTYAFHPYVQKIIRPLLKVASNMDPKQVDTNICHVKPLESIKKVTIPCFFICCKQDALVSIEAIKRVYDGAGGFKKLWLTNGREHCDSFFYNPEVYHKRVNSFITAVLDRSYEQKKSAKIIEDCIDLHQHLEPKETT
jgi:pimeloyl-ACP methyl ester carboxylesterase